MADRGRAFIDREQYPTPDLFSHMGNFFGCGGLAAVMVEWYGYTIKRHGRFSTLNSLFSNSPPDKATS